MIFGLFRRNKGDETIRSLYGAIVAQSRNPAFFRDHGVADTVEGRFEMVALHMFLVLHRLKEESAERRELGQALVNLMFFDLDRGLRELGVADTKVPRRIKKMGAAFYGRVKAYDEALAGGEPRQLEQALLRNLLGRLDGEATALAAYVRAASAELAALPFEHLARARISFPRVERI